MKVNRIRMALPLCLCLLVNAISGQAKLSAHHKALMGTKFTILLPDHPGNDSIAEIAFSEVERLNHIFSTYDSTSEVSKINNSKKWIKSSPEMLELIKFSEQLFEISEGTFDIKIGHAINIWKASIKEKRFPDEKKLHSILNKKRKIRTCGKWVKTNLNTHLDFGGIAKGYAVDKAFLMLKKMGYDTVLIDGGGDIRMGEAPYGKEGWKIMVSNDQKNLLSLKKCAIATSGYEYQHLKIGEVIYSHIIDPRTLQSIKIKRGVSVISADCKTADALATSFSVCPSLSNLDIYYLYKIRIKEEGNYIIQDF